MDGFVIYSMGDPEFIRLALLGLSHAFEQGALSIAKIGLMLGLLVVFWKGAWAPGKIEFKQFFIGFFLVIILFGKQVNVTLVHADGGADAMPPIPIGIALAATITTTFGYSMANAMRDFYHTTYIPGDVQTGDYLAMINGEEGISVAGNGLQPLRELMKMRFDGNSDSFTASTSYSAAGIPQQSPQNTMELSESLENYIHDCVLKDEYNKREVQEVSPQSMKTTPWAWDSMRVGYDGWSTTVKLDPGQGWRVVGCGEAFNKLTTALSNEGKHMVEHASSASEAANEMLVNSAQAMLGSVNTEAWKIKMNQILHYHYKKVKTRSQWASQGELMASQAEFEAMDKRRISTATQHSLWSEMAIPLITFLESFIYLIGPLMPFVIAFGEKGAGIVMKYFFMILWVNTWPILQVGVNMYLQNYINKASFATAPYDPFSWAGFNNTFTELESFIAMGSTLQTMVPALSLMLIYGTSQAAINLANSANKGGGSEGSVATPTGVGAANNGKMSVGTSSASYDRTSSSFINGYNNTAVANGMKQHSLNAGLSTASSESIQQAEQATHQAARQVGSSVNEMMQSMQTSGNGRSVTLADGAQSSEGMQRAASFANQLMENSSMSAENAKTLGLALSGGLGAKAQMSAAAALGFSPSEKKSLVKGNAAIGADASIDASVKAKLDNALKGAESWSQSTGETTSFADSKQGAAVLSQSLQRSENGSTSSSDSWGTTGQKMESATESWTAAQSQIQAEQRAQQATNALGSNVSFNMNPVTSRASQNHTDEGLADGTLLTNSARDTAMNSMNNTQMENFNRFKANGDYKPGINGDIKALKDFSRTSEGASLRGMSSNFKTTDENKQDYADFIKRDTGGDMSVDSVAAATGRYADKAFQNILNTSGSNRFEAGANFLDYMNKSSGGNQAEWTTAARDLRAIGEEMKSGNQAMLAEKPLAPKLDDNKPPSSSIEELNQSNDGMKDKAKQGYADQNSKIDATDIKEAHEGNKTTLKGNEDFDKTPEFQEKSKAISKVGEEVQARVKEADKATTPLNNTLDSVGKATRGAAETVAEEVEAVAGWALGSEQEQATNRLVAAGVNEDTAKLITGEGNNAPQAKIAEVMARGLSKNATEEQQQQAVNLMAAANSSQQVIQELKATGKPEDLKMAQVMEAHNDKISKSLESSQLPDVEKAILKNMAREISSGSMSYEEAQNALKMLRAENYDPSATSGTPSSVGSEFAEKEAMLAGGKTAMRIAENAGLTGTEEYQSLKGRVEETEKFLASNQVDRATSIAEQAYVNDGLSSGDGEFTSTKNLRLANAIIEKSIGKESSPNYKTSYDTTGSETQNDRTVKQINASSQKGAFKDNDSLISSYASFFSADGISKNVAGMAAYETIRPGLLAASAALHEVPELQEQASKLDATIAKYDAQMAIGESQGNPVSDNGTTGVNSETNTKVSNSDTGTNASQAPVQSNPESTGPASNTEATQAGTDNGATAVSSETTTTSSETTHTKVSNSDTGTNASQAPVQSNPESTGPASNTEATQAGTDNGATAVSSETTTTSSETTHAKVSNSDTGTNASQAPVQSNPESTGPASNTEATQAGTDNGATAVSSETTTTSSETTHTKVSNSDTGTNASQAPVQSNPESTGPASNTEATQAGTDNGATAVSSETTTTSSETTHAKVSNSDTGTNASQAPVQSNPESTGPASNTEATQAGTDNGATAVSSETTTTSSETTHTKVSNSDTGTNASQAPVQSNPESTGPASNTEATQAGTDNGATAVSSETTTTSSETTHAKVSNSDTGTNASQAPVQSNPDTTNERDSGNGSMPGKAQSESLNEVDSEKLKSDIDGSELINVSKEGFADLQALDVNDRVTLGGEEFTKVGEANHAGLSVVRLQHDQSGEQYNLYQDSRSGGGNLTIDPVAGEFR